MPLNLAQLVTFKNPKLGTDNNFTAVYSRGFSKILGFREFFFCCWGFCSWGGGVWDSVGPVTPVGRGGSCRGQCRVFSKRGNLCRILSWCHTASILYRHGAVSRPKASFIAWQDSRFSLQKIPRRSSVTPMRCVSHMAPQLCRILLRCHTASFLYRHGAVSHPKASFIAWQDSRELHEIPHRSSVTPLRCGISNMAPQLCRQHWRTS